jgi:hypothetical protein
MQFLDREEISYCCESTPIAMGCTNAVEIFENPRYFILCWRINVLI